MPGSLFQSPSDRSLWSASGRFDPWALTWVAGKHQPADLQAIDPVAAVSLVYSQGNARRIPVGIIGPRTATPEQTDMAERLGRLVAQTGLPLLCGGKSGVMEAVCKGNLEADGQPMALLPEGEWTAANPYVAVPLATGIGEARNAVIARACFALIAVAGEYGTLSEMAFGLHFNRLVVALPGAPSVKGALACERIEEAVEAVCAYRLREA